MIVSRCCKEKVWVEHANEGASYYVCGKCDTACDTLSPLSWMSEGYDDTGNAREVEALFNSA